MHLAFIVTNYNNSKLTLELIESIKGLKTEAICHILVVDNDSRAEEQTYLRGYQGNKENLHFIFSDKNLGYFGGLNLGLKQAYALMIKFDYLIIGNNDLIFPPDFVNQITKVAKKIQDCPVVSPNIVTLDGEHQNPHVISAVSKPREIIYDLYYSSYYLSKLISKIARITKKFTDRADESHHAIAQFISQGYGACYILTDKFVEEFQFLWAPTFMMSEESFLSIQLYKKGYKTYYEPSIIVKHHCHATMGQLKSKFMWQLAKDAHREYRKYTKIF